MHFANSDRPVYLYNLDVIISVGYEVKSKNGVPKEIGSYTKALDLLDDYDYNRIA